MKIYRWYSEALNMNGVTAVPHNATAEEVIAEVEVYIDNTFNDAQFVDDLLISVWIIEDDDHFNDMCPTTIAISY